MAITVATTTVSPATAAFNGRHLDRCQDGTLWAAYANGNNPALSYSKDNGATWTASGGVQSAGTPVALSNASDIGALFIDLDDNLHYAYRSNNNIYYVRATPNAGRTAWTFGTALQITNYPSSIYLGGEPDVVAHRDPAGSGGWFAHLVYANNYNSGPTALTSYSRVTITSTGSLTFTSADLSPGYNVNALTYPSIDFNHTGDGKTVAGGTPHLYVGWTAGTATGTGFGIRFRKAVYSAGAWTWNPEREIDPNYYSTASTCFVTFFDGTRVVLAGYMGGSAPSSAKVFIYDRDAADTTTTPRTYLDQTNVNVLFEGSASYDNLGNVYIIGRQQNASGVQPFTLSYVKWSRASATLGPYVQVGTVAEPYLSARRGYAPGSSFDYIYTNGSTSPYTVTFDRLALNTAPNAPTLTAPANNVSIDRTVTQRFAWTFSGANPGDTQSKYDLQYRVVGTTPWTVVSASTPNAYADIASGTFAAGSQYEWQVRTYEQSGLVGPYSASNVFTAATPSPGPTITAPTSGSTIATPTYTVTWSQPNQDAYEVLTTADSSGTAGATVYDSGVVTSSTTRSLSVPFATNGVYQHVQVRTQYQGLWSPYSDVRVLVSYTQPATPTVVVTPNSAAASITVTVTNPTPSGSQPTVSYVDIYRRRTADGGAGGRVAAAVASTFTDLTPASGTDYQYLARAYGSNGTTADSAWIG